MLRRGHTSLKQRLERLAHSVSQILGTPPKSTPKHEKTGQKIVALILSFTLQKKKILKKILSAGPPWKESCEAVYAMFWGPQGVVYMYTSYLISESGPQMRSFLYHSGEKRTKVWPKSLCDL